MDTGTSYTEKEKEHGATNVAMEAPGHAHEALHLVLAYLPLMELLTMTEVCRSLREAVNNDVLLWRDLVVDRPLNFRITNEILLKFACKADGRLRTLALICCVKITDDGLQRVAEKNPLIEKAYLTTCTGLSPNGVLRAVETLTQHNHHLKSLKINGIYNINKQHLKTLDSFLQLTPSEDKQNPIFFHGHKSFSAIEDTSDRQLDVEVCPKCKAVRLVFDCSGDACKRKAENPLMECRGCYFCIPRCEECGVCVQKEETMKAICGDFMCLHCWLKSPKCDFCNKPYCSRHGDRWCAHPDSTLFVCDICDEKPEVLLSSILM